MNKYVEHYQEKFTEARVDLLRVLNQAVGSGEFTSRQAVEKFAKICLMSPVEARKYMYLMDNMNCIWNFKL